MKLLEVKEKTRKELLAKPFNRQDLISSLMVFIAGLVLYKWIIYYNINTDLQGHVSILLVYLSKNALPPVPLYYLAIYVVSLFSTKAFIIYRAVILVLAFSIAFKYLVSVRFLNSIVKANPGMQLTSRPQTWIRLLVVSLLLVTPFFIPAKYVYIGKLGINVWHNSTVIFLMPFAILLFWQSVNFLKTGNTSLLYSILALCAFNLLIKPSFYFAFAPVFTVFTFLKFRFGPEFRKAMAVIFVSGLILLGIFIATYFDSILDEIYRGRKSGVIVAPFAVWKLYSENLLFDFLVSVSYPLGFLIVYFNRIRNSLVVNYAVCLFLISVLLYIVLAESGPRLEHANFLWQVIVTNFILFLVCVAYNVKFGLENGFATKKNFFLLFLYSLHFVSGLFYLHRILLENKYL